MIIFLRGSVHRVSVGIVDLNVGGVGYRAFVPDRDAQALSVADDVLMFTHHHVREDDESLYGFLSETDLRWFELLLGISGIGPKVALQIVSAARFDDFAGAVAAEDAGKLAKLPGIGRKTAERLVLELKDKLGKVSAGGPGSSLPYASGPAFDDALSTRGEPSTRDLVVEALETLGYNRRQAMEAAGWALADAGELPIEEGIRRCLRYLDNSAVQGHAR